MLQRPCEPASAAAYTGANTIVVQGGRLVNVHVCDERDGGKLCLPGKGNFDFGELAGALRQIGYEGAVILEPYPELFDTPSQLVQAVSYLKMKFE